MGGRERAHSSTRRGVEEEALANAYAHSCEDVLKSAQVAKEQGLSDAEVEERLAQFGANELPAKESTPLWRLFLNQFDDKMVKILLLAAAVSFVLAFTEEGSERAHAFAEPFIILTILCCNAGVGVWQERNADKAIESLKEFQPNEATAVRNGQKVIVAAAALVPGDIVEVKTGNKVPADLRLLVKRSAVLRLDQSMLTGESDSVGKEAAPVPSAGDLQGQKCMLFSGTDVARGEGLCVVTATGTRSQLGHLKEEMDDAEGQKTPLEEQLDSFGDALCTQIMWVCILVWAINVPNFREHGEGNLLKGALYYFKIAVSLAVAAIPEGLPAVVTTCLALGSRRMAKKNAIVKKLPSVETLGCTTVICSDKTGTLTTNQQSVRGLLFVAPGGRGCSTVPVTGKSLDPSDGAIDGGKISASNHKALRKLCHAAVLANSATLIHSDGKWGKDGEAGEACLLTLAEKAGVSVEQERAAAGEPITKLEFDSVRKMMSVVVRSNAAAAGGVRSPRGAAAAELLLKGAPEMVVDACDWALTADGDRVKMTPALRGTIIGEMNTQFATKALRCMAHAVKELSGRDASDPAAVAEESAKRFDGSYRLLESGLTFVGIDGKQDPPRDSVPGAIARCEQAGIRVVVITGDAKPTAEAICREIGVLSGTGNHGAESVTGAEFGAMGEAAKRAAVQSVRVFSRTSPSHKKEIVRLLKGHGHIVSMTGDGVNDAPALKEANIGLGMGSGTSVAKEASDMVLADDNFTTIVNAVEEGRAIYNNTKAFIRYLISSNIGEVVSIFFAAAIGIPEVLVPITLLWVNLVTDGLPATALSFNKPDADVMEKPPRAKGEKLMDTWLLIRYFVIGIWVGLATVEGYVWWQTTYAGGPQLTLAQLRSWGSCSAWATPADKSRWLSNMQAHSLSPLPAALKADACKVFDFAQPRTVSLSILVAIEMFNALNAVSENQSILTTPPWKNMWLIGAILLSFGQHFAILYTPVASIFDVRPMTAEEWMHVVGISFPVIILDELLKLVARRKEAAARRHSHSD